MTPLPPELQECECIVEISQPLQGLVASCFRATACSEDEKGPRSAKYFQLFYLKDRTNQRDSIPILGGSASHTLAFFTLQNEAGSHKSCLRSKEKEHLARITPTDAHKTKQTALIKCHKNEVSFARGRRLAQPYFPKANHYVSHAYLVG